MNNSVLPFIIQERFREILEAEFRVGALNGEKIADLVFEFIFWNTTTGYNALQGSKRKLFPLVIWNDDLLTRGVITPFLVTTTLRNKNKTVLMKYPDNLIGFQSGNFTRPQESLPPQKLYPFALFPREKAPNKARLPL